MYLRSLISLITMATIFDKKKTKLQWIYFSTIGRNILECVVEFPQATNWNSNSNTI